MLSVNTDEETRVRVCDFDDNSLVCEPTTNSAFEGQSRETTVFSFRFEPAAIPVSRRLCGSLHRHAEQAEAEHERCAHRPPRNMVYGPTTRRDDPGARVFIFCRILQSDRAAGGVETSMSFLSWLPVLFASSSPNNSCTTQGPPLLEIRQGSDNAGTTTTTRIYASGAWTLAGGGHRERGCFDRTELRAIRSAVQRAPWKITSSPIACFAYDPNYAEYLVHGRLRYTARMCSGKSADSETLRAIGLVSKELAEERQPPPAPPSPPAPPVACSTTGTPMFEIHRRHDGTAAMSTIAIYSSGAWTVTPIDEKGRSGASTTGCFDRPTTASLRDAITHSPWDATLNPVMCKAYSASYTEYHVQGKLEYTARLCGPQRIDDKSRSAIESIEAALVNATPNVMPAAD